MPLGAPAIMKKWYCTASTELGGLVTTQLLLLAVGWPGHHSAASLLFTPVPRGRGRFVLYTSPFSEQQQCGGLDTALCLPALPAALGTFDPRLAAGKAGEHKAVSRPPHSERKLANTLAAQAVCYD